ncbi:MAG: hypothetical protein IJA55_01330 [Clostridia bacterium]|nr:hypothetical protein [Clostridia bacterium]
MKKIPASILFGAAAVLATVILYFVILGNVFSEIICFITLMGVVFAEIVTTALAYFSKGEPRKVASAVAVSLMVPISLILSVVYIVNFPEGYGTYAGLYFVALIILSVIAAVIWNFSNNRIEENNNFQNAKANMLNMRNMVKRIMLEPNAQGFKKELSDIEEKLHYSNDSVIKDADAMIFNMLVVLQNNINTEGFDVAAQIKAIAKEVDIRNI